MTKKRRIVETTSEQNPEVFDFDAEMPEYMRRFANALQGLKSYCIDHKFDFGLATIYYQTWMHQALAANVPVTVMDAMQATVDYVQSQVAVAEALEGLQSFPPGLVVAPADEEADKLAERTESYYVEAAKIGFPKDQAQEIFANAMVEVAGTERDVFERAREMMAQKIHEAIVEEGRRANKLTLAMGRNGKPVAIEVYKTLTWRERIQRNFGI